MTHVYVTDEARRRQQHPEARPQRSPTHSRYQPYGQRRFQAPRATTVTQNSTPKKAVLPLTVHWRPVLHQPSVVDMGALVDPSSASRWVVDRLRGDTMAQFHTSHVNDAPRQIAGIENYRIMDEKGAIKSEMHTLKQLLINLGHSLDDPGRRYSLFLAHGDSMTIPHCSTCFHDYVTGLVVMSANQAECSIGVPDKDWACPISVHHLYTLSVVSGTETLVIKMTGNDNSCMIIREWKHPTAHRCRVLNAQPVQGDNESVSSKGENENDVDNDGSPPLCPLGAREIFV